MRLLLILASGVNLIFVTAFALQIRMAYVTSHQPRAYFINLPGGSLLCVDGGPGADWTTWSCSTLDGSPAVGTPSPTVPSSERTLPLWKGA